MLPDLPTPAILIDGPTARRNVERMAAYAREHRLKLRPHTKTHKSTLLGRMQVENGAAGLGEKRHAAVQPNGFRSQPVL